MNLRSCVCGCGRPHFSAQEEADELDMSLRAVCANLESMQKAGLAWQEVRNPVCERCARDGAPLSPRAGKLRIPFENYCIIIAILVGAAAPGCSRHL